MRTKQELYQAALRTVALRRQTARANAEDARLEAEAAIPALRHAEDEVRVRGIRCALAGAAGKDRTEAAAALSKARQELTALLAASGRPADALEPKFTCKLCQDTGSVQGRTCTCVHKLMQGLRREEIEACRGAIQVVVSVQEFDQKGGFCRSSGSNPLCITGVRVKLTGEPAGWMIFHHFLWNTAPPFHGTAAIQLCRYTSRMSCGAPPERSPAGFCTIGTGRPSGRPTTLWRRIPPPTDIRASMDSGTFSGHFLCPLRHSTGGAMWSMPPMKFLTQNTEMCRIAGSITAIRTDFCNTRQLR